MGTLDGKTAIVTGGGSGVGRGISLALAGEGAAVVVAGRTESTLAETRRMIEERGGRAAVSVCDITVPDDVDACIALAVERFGGVDILVNNATLVPHGSLLETSEELADDTWRAENADLGARLEPLAHGGEHRGVLRLVEQLVVDPGENLEPEVGGAGARGEQSAGVRRNQCVVAAVHDEHREPELRCLPGNAAGARSHLRDRARGHRPVADQRVVAVRLDHLRVAADQRRVHRQHRLRRRDRSRGSGTS